MLTSAATRQAAAVSRCAAETLQVLSPHKLFAGAFATAGRPTDGSQFGAGERHAEDAEFPTDTVAKKEQKRPVPDAGGLSDTPQHELGSGGLYESARKDRENLPSNSPGNNVRNNPDPRGQSLGLPAESYPVHSDPSTQTQHPDEAYGGSGKANTKSKPDQSGAKGPWAQ